MVGETIYMRGLSCLGPPNEGEKVIVPPPALRPQLWLPDPCFESAKRFESLKRRIFTWLLQHIWIPLQIPPMPPLVKETQFTALSFSLVEQQKRAWSLPQLLVCLIGLTGLGALGGVGGGGGTNLAAGLARAPVVMARTARTEAVNFMLLVWKVLVSKREY
jgi:hypothetical protein